MNKSTFAKTACAALAAALASSGCAPSGKGGDSAGLEGRAAAAAEAARFKPPEGGAGELHIYTWSDYIAPEVIERFEKDLGCKVVIDTFDSNEAMYAKLKAGGTGYDIITPSSYQISLMAKEGMIRELDQDRLGTVKANFDKSFEKQVLDPSFKYSVPYAVTYTGFAYLKDKIPEGADVNSWSILGCSALKGRITLLDDIREVIGAGLLSLGRDINSTNPADIDAAVEQVLKWKPNVRKFDSESYKTEVASKATTVGMGYSTDVMQVILGDEENGVEARDDVGFALPKEGFCVAFDEMVIASDAKNPGLAYAFMNYIYDGAVAKVNMEYIGGPNPVEPGIYALEEDFRSQIILPEELLSKARLLKPLDDAAMELYNKAWDKIKATGGTK
jgi:spermidine/putrescine transport system substrate-binding protein